MLTPCLQATYAPKGQRPVIESWEKSFKHIYVCSAISPQGDFVYTLNDQHYDSQSTIGFLKELMASTSKPITLILAGRPVPTGPATIARRPSENSSTRCPRAAWNSSGSPAIHRNSTPTNRFGTTSRTWI